MNQRKKKKQQPKLWLSYEEVAAYLLNRFAKEFGLSSVEGKQKIPGLRSGTPWEIDAKGITEDGKGFFIVECSVIRAQSKIRVTPESSLIRSLTAAPPAELSSVRSGCKRALKSCHPREHYRRNADARTARRPNSRSSS